MSNNIYILYTFIGCALSGMVSCGMWEDNYSLTEYESVEYSGSIRLSLTHPYQIAEDDYEILIASSPDTKYLGLCVDDEAPDCQKDAPGYHPAAVSYANDRKMFFKTEHSALLQDGLIFNILAHNKQGELIDQRKVKFERIGPKPAATGTPTPSTTGTTSTTSTTTTPPTGVTPPTDTTTAAAGQNDQRIKSIVSASCGGGSCHTQYAANPASLKGSSASSLIKSGQMPKGRSISATDRQALLDYLK